MNDSNSIHDFDYSINQIELALRKHARVVLDSPQNIAAIIEAGNALREAILEYERILMDETGWSNPIRHLGPLPRYLHGDQQDDTSKEQDSTSVRVKVNAQYIVAVDSEWEIATFVEARGGNRPSSVVEAIKYLYESDGWDVLQYPPRRVRLIQDRCDVSLADEDL